MAVKLSVELKMVFSCCIHGDFSKIVGEPYKSLTLTMLLVLRHWIYNVLRLNYLKPFFFAIYSDRFVDLSPNSVDVLLKVRRNYFLSQAYGYDNISRLVTKGSLVDLCCSLMRTDLSLGVIME